MVFLEAPKETEEASSAFIAVVRIEVNLQGPAPPEPSGLFLDVLSFKTPPLLGRPPLQAQPPLTNDEKKSHTLSPEAVGSDSRLVTWTPCLDKGGEKLTVVLFRSKSVQNKPPKS